jgi:hypothetical protein
MGKSKRSATLLQHWRHREPSQDLGVATGR